MKYFLKAEEPAGFSAWKIHEAERLEPYYETNNADAAWNHLPSKLPVRPEAGIHYFSKAELASELLREQGYLCCYCNRLIHTNDPKPGDVEFNDRRTTIEHFAAKETDARRLVFQYENLGASCRGGEILHKGTQPRVSYCNNRRENKPLPILPTQADCEEKVRFALDGQIFGATEEIESALHQILGLHFLDEARRAEIRAFYYANSEEHDGWDGDEMERPELRVVSTVEARRIIAALSQKDRDSGKYEEFCSAIIHVLKHEILNEV